ncbi:TPA: hypothetical protein HA278_04285 [Candidatus Woesearchaeota archaeon]|jgi:hypothetical protein|nr:hypothetical protein [Candidatus Woesearchaeota archaeon]
MSNKVKTTVPDVRIHDQDSVFMFWPISTNAKGWVSKHMKIAPDMSMGPHFLVEHRFVDNLIQRMQGAGLTVESY